VFFWAAMVVFEGAALVWKRHSKLLAAIGFGAIVFAVTGEAVGRKYDHRKDFLYEQRETQTQQETKSKIDAANADARSAKNENAIAKEQSSAAQQDSAAAHQIAQEAQAEAEALRQQQAPRILSPSPGSARAQ
jgi:hypothetical protein